MPQQYTIQEMAKEIRDIAGPGTEHIPDMTLVGKVIAQNPAMKGMLISEHQPYVSPMYQGGDTARTAGQVASDAAANVLTGIPKIISSLPGQLQGFFHAGLNALSPQSGMAPGGPSAVIGKAIYDYGKQAIPGMVSPFKPVAQSAIGKSPGPEDPSWAPAQQAAGTLLGGEALGQAAGAAGPLAARIGDATGITDAVTGMARDTAVDSTLKALRPRTREMKAVAQNIAPELAQRQIGGMTGAKFDDNIFNELAKDKANLHAQEDAVKPGTRLSGFSDYVVPKIDNVLASLAARKANGGALAPHDAVINGLQTLRKQANNLGPKPLFSDVVQFRRNLDETLQEQGGFKQALDSAQYAHKVAARSVANVTRDAINTANPDLAAANKAYHVSRSAADIVGDRELGQVGKPDVSGLDLVMGMGGYAMEGIPGAAAITGLRHFTQSRGIQATLARGAQSIGQNAPTALGAPPPPLTDWRDIQDQSNRQNLKMTYDPNDIHALVRGQNGPGLGQNPAQMATASSNTIAKRPDTHTPGVNESLDLIDQAKARRGQPGLSNVNGQLMETGPDTAGFAQAVDTLNQKKSLIGIDKSISDDMAQRINQALDWATAQKNYKTTPSFGEPHGAPFEGQRQIPATASETAQGSTSYTKYDPKGNPIGQAFINLQQHPQTAGSALGNLPHSPSLDRLSAGMNLNALDSTERWRLNEMSQTARTIQQNQGVDAIGMVDKIVGSSELRARIMNSQEGRNVIQSFLEAKRAENAPGIKNWANRIEGLAVKELRKTITNRY